MGSWREPGNVDRAGGIEPGIQARRRAMRLDRRDVGRVADDVFRTVLDRPGFAHLALGPDEPVGGFRRWLVGLARALGEEYGRRFGRRLELTSLGWFDQQVSTEAHRDGGPDESVLVLGYEPTSVGSRLWLYDHTRAADDRGLTPAVFLERFNPLTEAGRRALEGHETELTAFAAGHYQAVVVNNGNRAPGGDSRGMLGVLHRALIPRPDPTARRVINSMMLAPADPLPDEAVTSFLTERRP